MLFFCEECGAQLVNADSLVTQNIQVDEGRNADISGNDSIAALLEIIMGSLS